MLKEEFSDQPLRQTNWQSSIKEALLSPSEKDLLKILKDYALMAGELYKKLPGGVLARCLSPSEEIRRKINAKNISRLNPPSSASVFQF